MRKPLTASVLAIVASAALLACDRSDRARQVGAIPDDSEYGVITAPQQGTRPDQPQIEGQPNTTTATVAKSDPSSTAPRLGDQPATSTQNQSGSTTQSEQQAAAPQNPGTQPAQTPAPATATPAPPADQATTGAETASDTGATTQPE